MHHRRVFVYTIHCSYLQVSAVFGIIKWCANHWNREIKGCCARMWNWVRSVPSHWRYWHKEKHFLWNMTFQLTCYANCAKM